MLLDFSRKQLKDLMRDLTSLGSGYFFLLVTLIAWMGGAEAVALRLLAGIVVLYTSISAVRWAYHKDRPEAMDHNNVLEKMDASSFPSLHSANSFYVAYILHDALASNPFAPLLFVMAGLIAYSRIYLRKHFLVDVVAGSLTGLGAAYLVLMYI